MSNLTARISDLSDSGLSLEKMRKTHLLAASAGTGKTYSIQTLYLRLILIEALTVQQILVVTFTKDATKELRDRLQSVLRGALDYVNGISQIKDANDRTKKVVDKAVEEVSGGKDAVKRLLQLALLDFDMAAIYTIHGFCQRVLNRFAFETKQAFDVEPTGDTSDEIDQLCRDWWRRHVYSIDDKVVGLIGERGEFSLEAITALARKIIAKPDAILSPEVKCGGEIDDRIKGLLTGFPVQEKEIDDLADMLDCVRGPIREIQNQLSEFRSAVENREWDKALSVLRDAVQFEKKAVNPCSDAAARLQEDCAGLVRPRMRADSFSYDSNGFLKSEKCPDLTPAHTERIREAVEELNARIAKYESFFVVKMRNGAPVKPYSNFEILARHFSGQRIEAPDLFETIKKAAKEGVGLAEQVKVTVDGINPAFRVFWNSLLEECHQSACCAALDVKRKYQESRATATSASFDDLLVNLREALAEDNSGLTVALRNEFRAALIDEFQDTDPVQWGIFEKLFKDTRSPCFLVGDPKQAIYRFRNGDIETYLHATESIVERYPLNENYRSEKRLIDAVNQIFMDSDQRSTFGEGIEYNQPLSAAGKEKGKSLISFNSKEDAAEPDKGNIDKHPFKIFLIEDNSRADLPGNNSRAARAAYELTAAGIAVILNNDKLAIGAKPVRKKDIAVLVNTHEQADRIAEELKRLNIPSVRQGTGNVWSTDEAGIMLVVLEAVLDSRNIANVKHALLTSWCGLTVEQIWNLNEGGKVKVSVGREEQDYGLADWVAVFEGLHETWLKRGFPAMFRKLTGILDLKKRLLTAGDKQGQRRLANINHLSETIEEKIIGDRKTPEGVLSWIRQQFDKSTADRGDELKLRLETDDDAVRILTVFTSKGLEFPIVFAPTLFMMKSRRGRLPEYHEGSNLVIATDEDEESKAREKDEMEREQVRQIYVALTRAVHRTVVVALRNGVKDGEANAGEKQKYKMKGILGEVLRLPMKKVEEDQQEKIVVDLDKVSERFSNVGGVKCAVEVKEYAPAAVLPITPTPAAVVAPKTKPKVDASKGMGSFSSLAPGEKKKTEEMTSDVSVDTTGKDRDDAALPRAVEQIIEKPEGIFAFPYGAKTGTCWHEIFEDLTFSASDAEIRKMTEDKLRIHGFLKKKEKEEERISLTAGMVKNVLKTPLPKLVDADCFALESVPDNDRKTEWEFSFATLSGKKTSELQKVIATYEQYKPFVDALGVWDKEIPGGYLTGFVDLLFRKDGRFYIVDWKSNRRNGAQRDFLQKGLEEEISLHRYWVQYLIYCVAVHQYLSKAMDGYKYETHFGGAYYIFLRGVDGKKGPDGAMNGIYANRPPEALVKELSAILGGFFMNTALGTINKLQVAGFFGSLDVQMAGLVSRMMNGADEELLLAAALASRTINEGHACVDLAKYAGRKWADVLEECLPMGDGAENAGEDDEDGSDVQADYGTLPDLDAWIKSLDGSVVGSGRESGNSRTLLVLKGSKLYLRRYWNYERKVEAALESRNVPSGKIATDAGLKKYFAAGNRNQLEAAAKAVQKRLSILSGGPGTGKTYTLARVVALLADMNSNSAEKFDVRIAAPTGKAAVRMVESIKEAKKGLKESGIAQVILDTIPEEASTIHRLLGSKYNSPYFKHDSKNPLTADMVIVDEASMVDLPLMAKLLEALPADCILMLVGDIDQLASVEPGRVYGDVCAAAEDGRPLAGCLTKLTESRRFSDSSDIGRISKLINAGSADAWKTLQEVKGSPYLNVLDAATLTEEKGGLVSLVTEKMADFLKADKPEAALEAGNKFRILCAMRKGPYGVDQMNRRVEKILSEKGLNPGGRFYDHQIIMIKVNTPALNLYNGDVGVVLARDGAGGRTKEFAAWFYDKDKAVRAVPVNLLPEHETAFAMTVHKSQGSEFPHVALILPDKADSPVLTRELLYTGMTRVKIDETEKTGKLTMWCSKDSFEKAVKTKTARTTGLFAESRR